MRCWGRKQRTASPRCPSPAQTWGGCTPSPSHGTPPLKLAGTAAPRDAAAAAQALWLAPKEKAWDGQDQAPRTVAPQRAICAGALLAALPVLAPARAGALPGTAAWAAAATCPVPSPAHGSTTAEREQLGKKKKDQTGVFQQCCFTYYFLPSQLKLSDELTELLKIKNNPLTPLPLRSARRHQRAIN